MKNNSQPAQNQEFRLENHDGEYMLYREGNNTAIYINDTTAVIWQLCNGENSVGEIKKQLKQAYPAAAKQISKDVDEALVILHSHVAIY